MARNFFDGTDAALYTGSNYFSSTITGSPTTYGLTAPQAVEYDAVNALYETAYLTAINPDTRTQASIAAKNAAKTALKVMASDYAKIIDATPSVTDAMKIELGLNVRKVPAPVPPPEDRPGMDLVSVVTRTVKVHIHDSASSIKRGKPDGAVAAWVYSFIGATYPTDPTEWQFEGSATKSTYDIVFPETVANGAQVWICAAWVNRRGESGPVSVPLSTNVQGGLTMAA